MKRQLTNKDGIKIAIALVLLLAAGGTTLSKTRAAKAQRENSAAIVQLTHEMGLPVVDTSKVKDDPNLERDNQLEQASGLSSASPR